MTTGTTFTASDSRTEIAPEEQDRAKTRVEFTPQTKEEQRKPKRLSRTGIGATLRGPKTNDRRKRRPPTAGSLRF